MRAGKDPVMFTALKNSPMAHSQSDSTIHVPPQMVLLVAPAAPSPVTHSLPGCLGPALKGYIF